MTSKLPSVGEVFLGRYELERVVGFGGYGRIYRARQLDLGRTVALKIIAPPDEEECDDVSESTTHVERFEREAKAISRLSDPHTITMYDHGSHDGLFYMVMEFVDGRTLKEIVTAEGPLDPARVARILRQVLHSLMEAHDLGLVHRDIKPSNIMLHAHLDEVDCVKVLDFGLVKSVRGEQVVDVEDLTRADMLIGTPRYMSPEQVRQEPLSAASDLYSLGLVAAEMLRGEPVLTETLAMAIVARHVSPQEFDLSDLPGPPGLREVVARMLRKKPAQRYSSAAEALAALEDWDARPRLPIGRAAAVLAAGVCLFAIGIISAGARPEPDEPRRATPVPALPAGPTASAAAPPPPPPPVGPVVDPDLERRLISSTVWAKVRLGAAVEVAAGDAEQGVERQRRQVRRRDVRRKEPETDPGGRKLRIFEP